jgi:hypothetical protein
MFLTQELDLQVDTQRFASEPEYAAQVLELAEEMGDHEVRMIAAQIRKRQLDLFSLNNVSAPAEGDSTVLRSPEDEPPQIPRKPI